MEKGRILFDDSNERKDFILMARKEGSYFDGWKERNKYLFYAEGLKWRKNGRKKDGMIECTLTVQEGGRDDFILMVWEKKRKEESYLDVSKGRKKGFCLDRSKKRNNFTFMVRNIWIKYTLMVWKKTNVWNVLWCYERKEKCFYFAGSKERILFWRFKRKIGRISLWWFQ